MNIHTWAAKWGVSPAAVLDLQMTLGLHTPEMPADDPGQGKSEAWAQSAVKLEASQLNIRLWRNNSGALKDAAGRLVRYGLANDSAALNAVLKSPDLIGWRAVRITPDHVGLIFGLCTMRELKAPGWQYTGTEHERAQWSFLSMALADGCDARFATGPGTLA